VIAKSVREANSTLSRSHEGNALYYGPFGSATCQILEYLSDETELNPITLFRYAFVNTPIAVDAHR
jgi:hypothetical protein